MAMLDGLMNRILRLHGADAANRAAMNFEGADGAEDVANNATVVRTGALKFTAPKSAPYLAAAGELVRLGVGGLAVTLPLAATCPGACVGVLQTAAQSSTVAATGPDTLGSAVAALTTVGSVVVLKSDGVSKWWILSRYTA